MWLALVDLGWRHRRPLLRLGAVLLVAGALALFWRHERSVWTEQGARAEQRRAFAARDTIATADLQAAEVHTDTVRDTVVRWIARYARDTVRDTVVVHGDTGVLVPLPVIARTDSLVRACSDLVTRCAAERAKARALLAVKDSEIAVLRAWTPPAPARHTTRHVLAGALLGAVAGYLLHR